MPDKELPTPKDPKRGLTRLFNIAPAEVSLVSSGANRRKFLFYKSSKGTGTMADSVEKGGPGSGRKPGEKGFKDHHNGTEIEHTGNSKTIAGGLFNEAKITEEGHHEHGKTIHVRDPEDKKKEIESDRANKFRGAVPQLDGKSRVKKDDDTPDMPANVSGGSISMSSVAKGGPGSGRRPGGGSGEKKEPEKKEEEKESGKTIGKTTSGKDIHEAGEKSTRGWTAQDHLDAFHAHQDKMVDTNMELDTHPAIQAARHDIESHGGYMRTPEEAYAVASQRHGAELKPLKDKSDHHYQQREKHYAAYKKAQAKEGSVKKASPAEYMAKTASYLDSYVQKDADSGEETKIPDAVKAVGKAVVRIMAPMAGQMPADLAHKLLELSGYDCGLESQVEKSKHEIDEDDDDDDDEVDGVKKSTLAAAVKAASAAYQEHLAKAGYGNGPKARMVLKLGGEPVKKSKGDHVSKSTDQAPDLSGLNPEVRERLEGVFKAQEELVKKNTELVAKNAELAQRIDGMQAENRKRELVAKASGYKNLALPQDQIVAQLEMADKLGKDSFELVCKSFDTLDGQARGSRLFGEIGSALPRGGGAGGDAWSQIEAAAQGWVAKSGKSGFTKEQATAAFLETQEGQRLYAEHQRARPEGV